MGKYYFRRLRNKKIVIFGTGKMAESISNKLQNLVAYYVDNNEQKWGTTFYNKLVCSPNKLKNENNNIVIIVASMYFQEILAQLEGFGFNENIQVINGNLLFVNLLNEEFEIAIINEYKLFSEKIITYLQLEFVEDIDQFLCNYESIVALDERISLIRKTMSMGYKHLSFSVLKSLIENFVSNSNSNFELHYEYNLAMQFEKNGDYIKALNYFEKVLARGVSENRQKIIIEKINQIEINYKDVILQQLNEEKKIRDNKDGLYVHLMIDNFFCNKFIKFIKEHFNKEEHVFIFLSVNKNLKYIEEENIEDVLIVNPSHLNYESNSGFILNYINNSRKVFIHFLTDFLCRFICRYEIKAELNWILWGGDLYSYIEFDLYDELTKNFLKKRGLYDISSEQYQKFDADYSFRKGVIRKLDNIIVWNNGDYSLVKKHFITNANKMFFLYSNPLSFTMLKDAKDNDLFEFEIETYKYKFLLGNSGTPSNNHLEIIKKLSELENKNFCLVVPLSYGNDAYIRMLIREGKRILGDQFIPLTKFLNQENYAKLLNKIDVAFMNHNRMQGIGNVRALVYLGKKVFMKKETTSFAGLTSIGVKLFDIKSLNKDDLDIDYIVSMDDGDKKQNRIKLFEYYNEKKIKEDFEVILNS